MSGIVKNGVKMYMAKVYVNFRLQLYVCALFLTRAYRALVKTSALYRECDAI